MANSKSVSINPNDFKVEWFGIYYPKINNLCEPLGFNTERVFKWLFREQIARVSISDNGVIGYRVGSAQSVSCPLN